MAVFHRRPQLAHVRQLPAIRRARRHGTASFSIWMLQVSCVFLFLLSFGDQFLKVSAPIFVDRVLE